MKKKSIDKSKSSEYFTCVGKVRGRCGHRHEALSIAALCLAKDAFFCVGKGNTAHTDREILFVKGGRDHRLNNEQLSLFEIVKTDEVE